MVSRSRALLSTAVLAAASAACVSPHSMSMPLAEPSCGAPGAASRSVGWVRPIREGDVEALREWCASVGPPHLAATPSPLGGAVGVAAASPELTIATWNVAGRDGDVRRFLSEALGYRCEARHASGHFVLLVQEAVRRSHVVPDTAYEYAPALPANAAGSPDLPTAARDCGLSLLYVPAMRNGAGGHEGGREDRGNAILSSLPLVDAGAIELPFEGQRRVAAVASIVLPETHDTVRVASFHLDAFTGVARTLVTGGASKERQVLGLVEALGIRDESGETRGNVTTIVAGDLNTWSERQTAVTRLARYFPESPPADATPTRGAFPTDHMFVRAARRDGTPDAAPAPGVVPDSYEALEDTYGSDHRPRLLRLTASTPPSRTSGEPRR